MHLFCSAFSGETQQEHDCLPRTHHIAFTHNEVVEKRSDPRNDGGLKREPPTGLSHIPGGLNQETLGQTLMRLGRSMAGLPSFDGFKITSDEMSARIGCLVNQTTKVRADLTLPSMDAALTGCHQQ